MKVIKIVPSKKFDIDFNDELPQWEFFSLWWLAQSWHCSKQHVYNLIASGELPVPADLLAKAASHSTIRVPRKVVADFLNRRKIRKTT